MLDYLILNEPHEPLCGSEWAGRPLLRMCVGGGLFLVCICMYPYMNC
jgi:hypothetical protein